MLLHRLDMCRRQYANDVCNRGTAGKVAQSANSSHRTAMNKESPNANRNLLLDNPPNALLLDSNVDLLWHFPTLHHFDNDEIFQFSISLFFFLSQPPPGKEHLKLFYSAQSAVVSFLYPSNATSHAYLTTLFVDFVFTCRLSLSSLRPLHHQQCCSYINQFDMHSRNPCKLYCIYLCHDNSPHFSYQVDWTREHPYLNLTAINIHWFPFCTLSIRSFYAN